MAPEPRIQLSVNGKILEGFESGTVQLDMESPTSMFDLEYVADGKKPGARAIFCGDECTLSIDAGAGLEKLVVGYVDSCEDEDAPDAIRLRVAGRSKTADLADCAAFVKPGSWNKARLSKLASDIAEPYKVKVTVDGDEGDPMNFSIIKGETAYEAIERAAMKRGLFPYAVLDQLVLTTAGATSSETDLERGKNVVSSTRSDSWYARYSEYQFYAQARATDENFGKNAAQITATASDPTITRHRLYIAQSEAATKKDLQLRVNIERSVRAGRGELITVVVDGWGMATRKVWRPNTLVTFKNPVLGVDAELIVARCQFRFGPSESRETVLTLMRPEAFLPKEPYPKTKRAQSFV